MRNGRDMRRDAAWEAEREEGAAVGRQNDEMLMALLCWGGSFWLKVFKFLFGLLVLVNFWPLFVVVIGLALAWKYVKHRLCQKLSAWRVVDTRQYCDVSYENHYEDENECYERDEDEYGQDEGAEEEEWRDSERGYGA